MDLIYKDSYSEDHPGYGAGSGTIDTTVYACPCGQGEVRRVKDNIPGFRETDWSIDCPDCAKRFEFDDNNKLVEK